MTRGVPQSESDAAARLEQIHARLRLDNAGHVSEALFSGLGDLSKVDLADLLTFQYLLVLHLDDTTVGNEDLRFIGRINSLRILFLTDCKRVSDEGLSFLSSLQRLHELDLTGTSITDSGLQCLTSLCELKKLYLTDTKVSDKGLAHLERMTSLRELSLINTRVTDSGLSHLLPLPHLHRLELVSTSVTDRSVDLLKQFVSLEYLYIQSTQITEEGARTLEKSLPGTEIWHPSL